MEKEKIRFSKKILILTMACTIIYAIVYMILCFKTGQLPDYSFNAGIFAALTAENWCNAWIKTKENQASTSKNNTDFIEDNLLKSDIPIQEEP